MIRSFLRRNHLFFINFISASGLLASSDLFVQLFYEKKKKLDEKRLCTYAIVFLSFKYSNPKYHSRGSTCYRGGHGRRRTFLVLISRSNNRSENMVECFAKNLSRSSCSCTSLHTHIYCW